MGKIEQYIEVIKKAGQRTWFKSLLFVWTLAAIYDLLLSQFIPEEYSRKAPKAWEVAAITGHMLPVWGWLLILASIIIVALLEQLSYSPSTKLDDHSAPHKDLWIPIHKAVVHVAESIGDKDESQCYPATLTALRQKAADGSLRMRGCKQLDDEHQTRFSDIHTNISKEYWVNSTIGVMATSPILLKDSHTNPETTFSWGKKGIHEINRYCDLMVDENEILKYWPKTQANLSQIQPTQFPEISINIGHDGHYVEANSYNAVNVMKSVLIGIKNSGETHLTNCKIMYEAFNQDTNAPEKWLVMNSFSLIPGEEKFITLASFNEPLKTTNDGVGLNIRLAGPPSGNFWHPPTLPKGGGAVTITASSAESKSCSEICKLWVEDNKLHWAKA